MKMNQTPYLDSMSVDYKEKVFELVRKNADLQLLLQKREETILSLNTELITLQTQVEVLFHNLNTAPKPVHQNTQQQNDPNHFETLIKQYQQIITKMHKKLQAKNIKHRKVEEKLQSEIIGLREQVSYSKQQNMKLAQKNSLLNQEKQQLNKKLQKLREELKPKNQRIEELEEQLEEAVSQSQSLFQEKKEIQERHQKDIKHFQEMENLVEKKLVQVQYEMNFYKKERKEHLQKISSLHKQIEHRQEEHQYSFGNSTQEQDTQTEPQQTDWTMKCYEESIKTLLQENDRLKKALVWVYKRDKDEKLEENVELQLKILMSTSFEELSKI